MYWAYLHLASAHSAVALHAPCPCAGLTLWRGMTRSLGISLSPIALLHSARLACSLSGEADASAFSNIIFDWSRRCFFNNVLERTIKLQYYTEKQPHFHCLSCLNPLWITVQDGTLVRSADKLAPHTLAEAGGVRERDLPTPAISYAYSWQPSLRISFV